MFEEAATDLKERVSEVKKVFTAPAIVGGNATPFIIHWANAKIASDDDTLALEPAAHDLILHTMSLHWADDPIGQMVQSRLALRPDGLFIAVQFGGQTLHELRTSLAEAETKLTGGLSPRILPMGDMRDLGALLQRAGFALPVADNRTLTVRYQSLSDLFRDIRGMGETNALAARRRAFSPRKLFALTEQIYRANFADTEGYLTATFELVYLTGWSPDSSQQKPLQPGTASTRLADALGVDESPTGDIADPKQR